MVYRCSADANSAVCELEMGIVGGAIQNPYSHVLAALFPHRMHILLAQRVYYARYAGESLERSDQAQ